MQISLMLRVLSDGMPLTEADDQEAVQELQRKGLVGSHLKLTVPGLNRARLYEDTCVCVDEGIERAIAEAASKATKTEGDKD
jgi:hypothetical protein